MRKKNIVYYVTKQYMKQNKKRTFTTFLGIVFMVLLMTCVFVGKDTALKYLETMAEKNSGNWHYCAYDVNGKQYEKIKKLPSITETAVSEEIGFTDFKQSENEKRPYLNIKAYTENCFDWRNIELVSGRFPENEQELIISESAVEDGSKISIGDKVSAEFFTRSITGIDATLEKTIFPFFDFLELHYGETVDLPEEFAYYGESKSFRENKDMTGKKQDYTVVRFMKSPSHEFSFHAGYAAFTYEEAPTTDCFNVTMKLNLKEENYTDDIENQLKSIMGEKAEIESNSLLLAFSASTGDSTMDILVVFIQVFFVLLILVASMILIYNLFNMSFDERSKYLGMLSSVGATGKQKRSSVYFEAFYLLLYALPIGFLIGLGVIKLGMLAIRPYVGMLMELSGSSELANVSLVISGKSVAPAEKDYYFCDLDDEDYESLKETIINDESVTDYVEWYEGMFFALTSGESYSKEYWNDYFEIMNLYYPEKLSQKKMDEMYKEKYCINVIAVDQNTYEKIAKASNCDMEIFLKQNGNIEVESEQGKGSCFHLKLYRVGTV